MRQIPLLLGLALAACACKGETEAAPPASSLFVSVAGEGEGRRPPEGFRGTWIDIVPGVEYRQTLVTGSGATPSNDTRINGHPFAVEGEYVVIGPKRYGPFAAGTHVEIRNEGVFAEGKHLGALPERVPVPPAGN
jgi:hypothetical protein